LFSCVQFELEAVKSSENFPGGFGVNHRVMRLLLQYVLEVTTDTPGLTELK